LLEIRLTPDNKVQYVDDGHVFYTSTKAAQYPLHVGAAISTVQTRGFERVQYLDTLPPAPPGASVSPPPPPTNISPPPPLPPGDYVIFDGGASADLAIAPGQVSRVAGSGGWNAAAWSNQDIWSPDGPRKGISFRCPLTDGGKMIGFVRDSFKTTSSYTDLDFCIYCGGTKVYAYEDGSNKGMFGAFGPGSVLEIRLTPDNKVQYVDDGHVFYTSTKQALYPLFVAAAISTVQTRGFERVQYLR